jgi:flavin reductase (DIM6/NTAB) family NADH-FMN oxidoreductase RutF
MRALDTDSVALRRAFGHLPSGVVAVCAATGTEHIGMAVSTFIPVSLEPPLVAFCVQNSSTTWPRLARQPRLGISVLGAEHAHAARSLAAKHGDRFTGIDTEIHDGGALFVAGCGLRMDVSVESQVPAGDHAIVVLRINELHCPDPPDDVVEPIVFHRSAFRTLANSQSQKSN